MANSVGKLILGAFSSLSHLRVVVILILWLFFEIAMVRSVVVVTLVVRVSVNASARNELYISRTLVVGYECFCAICIV